MEDNGLIHAFILDGLGGGRPLSWDEVERWTAADGRLWVHLAYDEPKAAAWIEQKCDLDPVVSQSLLSEETRPRSLAVGKGLLMTLRGINHNPGEDHEDMVSVRIWAEEMRIISTRKRRLLTVAEIADNLTAGRGPATSGEFIEVLTELLTTNIESAIDGIEEQAALLEEQVVQFKDKGVLRTQISAIRRKAILLRRYLAPQREALTRLQSETIFWIGDRDRKHLHETTNSLIRIIEDLDSIHERALVAQEELISLLSEQLNSRMYTLSLVTTIFLPLSFLTGLLGINVGGIPGADYPWAFSIVVIVVLVIVLGQLLYFRKQHWI
ncbi:MAG: zinc transporter ZntB [Proteobacteria bacterium]|nr:zinc transporter ZntB [Pseudomonadota bacterium]